MKTLIILAALAVTCVVTVFAEQKRDPFFGTQRNARPHSHVRREAEAEAEPCKQHTGPGTIPDRPRPYPTIPSTHYPRIRREAEAEAEPCKQHTEPGTIPDRPRPHSTIPSTHYPRFRREAETKAEPLKQHAD